MIKGIFNKNNKKAEKTTSTLYMKYNVTDEKGLGSKELDNSWIKVSESFQAFITSSGEAGKFRITRLDNESTLCLVSARDKFGYYQDGVNPGHCSFIVESVTGNKVVRNFYPLAKFSRANQSKTHAEYVLRTSPDFSYFVKNVYTGTLAEESETNADI